MRYPPPFEQHTVLWYYSHKKHLRKVLDDGEYIFVHLNPRYIICPVIPPQEVRSIIGLKSQEVCYQGFP
jgi:hypothetical protein